MDIPKTGKKIAPGRSVDERFMREVYNASWQSKDPRTKIGCVIVKKDDNDILTTGFNGFPRGVLDLEERYNQREIKHNLVKHAESNACLMGARKGVCLKNSILYTQGIPCHECAKDIIQVGVSEVVIHKQWPNLFHDEKWVKSVNLTKILFEESKIPIIIYDKILNMTGFVNGMEVSV